MPVRRPLSVAAAQPVCVPGDLVANAGAHAVAVRMAGTQLVVFPELSLTGYELDATVVRYDDPALDVLRAACAETGSVALVGAPVREGSGDHIATLRITGDGVDVTYRKIWLGDAEAVRFRPGTEPTVLELAGWRLGLAVCKDTGISAHTESVGRLGVDAYVAGLVHHGDELAEQDARGVRIARHLRVPVVFASAAGAVGTDYPVTAGTSTVWSPTGEIVARASAAPGDQARAVLDPNSDG